MGKGLFIAGTDTGIGKTLVTAGVVRWLRRRGIDAVPMKPVQTGAVPRRGRLVAPDLEFALATAGLRPDREEKRLMTPYLYEPACSPHLAGRLAGHYPELSRIKECADHLQERHAVVVAEGAGGIMAPLTESATTLALMQLLGYPVLLVARAGLGTINHCLLSVRALREAGLRLIGVVFNHVTSTPPEDAFIEADNPPTVARLAGVKVLGEIRHFEKLDAGTVWRRFEADMPGLSRIFDEVAR